MLYGLLKIRIDILVLLRLSGPLPQLHLITLRMIVQLNLVVSLHLLYFRKMLLRQGLNLDSIPLMDLRCYFIPDILVQMLDLFKDSPLKFGACASTLRQLVITVMFLAPIAS